MYVCISIYIILLYVQLKTTCRVLYLCFLLMCCMYNVQYSGVYFKASLYLYSPRIQAV